MRFIKLSLVAILTMQSIWSFSQEDSTLDSLLHLMMASEKYQEVSLAFPTLIIERDSTIWTVADLERQHSILDTSARFPSDVERKKWRLIDMSIPWIPSGTAVRFYCETKSWNKYEIRITIPFVNPAYVPSDGCCRDPFYLLDATYTIVERSSGFRILESKMDFWLPINCIHIISN